MRKLILRSIAASKGRLFLTMLSIIFGVAFVSGSFILADSLRSVFDKLSSDIFAGVDAVVRAPEGEVSNSEDAPRFDESIALDLGQVDGVASIEPGLSGFEKVYTVDAEGEVVRPQGPPVLTISWAGPSDLSSFTLIDGSAPTGQQVAIDTVQAEQGNFDVGDTIDVATPEGIEQFELSATIEFGSPGAMFVLFDLPTTQRVLGEPGRIDGIVLAAEDDVEPVELVANLQAEAPDGIEVVSAKTAEEETQAEFGEFITIFGNILLGFALVTLFVSIFIIYNTFAILVSQRKRQMGLLRAIGASGAQVRWMVLLESFVVGIIASIGGLFAGIGVASLLKWIFSQGGGAFPDGPLEIKLRTIIVVMVVGIFVTVVSAIAPALRASRISPLEALHDTGASERSMRFRIIAGSLVLIPGVILLTLGLLGTSGTTTGVLTLLGLGSVLTFVGVAMLSALFAGRVSALIGAPVEALRGTVGRLSRDNASRNPQRTAATATALMIGLALITGVSVLASSIIATFNDLLEDSLTADVFVFEEAQGLSFSPRLVEDLDALEETGPVAGFIGLDAVLGDETVGVEAFDGDVAAQIIAIEVVDGVNTVEAGEVLVFEDKAEDLAISVGDTLDLAFEDGENETLAVVGVFAANSILEGDLFIDRSTARGHLTVDGVEFIGLKYADGVDGVDGRPAVEAVAADFPQLAVQDNSEFQEGLEDQIGQILIIINALLGLCLIIAFFGIINTMALSVLERTREIGLLRAVGMTRSQLRSSVRWEAVIVGVFGALLGVIMGVLLAYAGISALPAQFITQTAIPWVSLALYIALGGVLGVVAAYFPARRAAKLDVLEAISTT